jgi:hypothetical protein
MTKNSVIIPKTPKINWGEICVTNLCKWHKVLLYTHAKSLVVVCHVSQSS